MLLEFGAKNFFCFKEGFEVSFRLGGKCPDEVSHGKNYTNVLCVKGANASGKTNVLKALGFLSEFCCDSFNRKPDDKILLETFFYNDEPAFFYVTFSLDNIEYHYELEIQNDEVIAETILRKDKRLTPIINRKQDKLVKLTNNHKDLEVIKLRRNASLISTAHQYEIESLRSIYDFFENIISNFLHTRFGTKDYKPELDYVSKHYFDDDKLFNFVKDIISKSDLGISDISIIEKVNEEGIKNYFPLFSHTIDNNVKQLGFHSQSSGTRSLFLQLLLYELVLDIGGVLVLDEFDINLHPDILPILVDLFLDKEINKKNAQLIFTTHNTGIMDKLGKYRSVLVNKENNESYLYRLDEIPGDLLRNDRPITPIYKAGKIGGVPRV